MINDRVFISESILVILRSIRLKVVVRSKIEFFIELCISMSVEILNGYGRLCRAIAAKDLEAVANGYSHYRSIAAKSGGEDTEEFCWTTSNTLRGSPYSSF